MPKGLSMAEAASLPETFFTVYSNVFERAGLRRGETLLVHGGNSGIGVTAIALAKAFGCRVIVTAGSDEKCRACLDLGADAAINYKTRDFVAEVTRLTDGSGVDVVLDMVGGDYALKNQRCLAVAGRLVHIAFTQGARGELDIALMMNKRLTITGSTLRPQSDEAKAAIAAALREHVWPLIEAGRIRPVIYRTFPMALACEAHRLMESGVHIGKIVLTH